MRKKYILFVVLGVFFAWGLLIFHKPLMEKGAAYVLRDKLVYESLVFQDGKFTLSGVRIRQGEDLILIDRVLVRPSLTFKNTLLKTDLTRHALHPLLKLLMPHTFYMLKFDVPSGLIEMGKQRFYFTFESSAEKDALGTLKVSLDPGLISHPFLLSHFEMRDGQLHAQVKMQEVETQQLVKLLPLLVSHFPRGWEGTQGLLDLEGHVMLSSNGALDELSAQFVWERGELMHPEAHIALKAERLEGTLLYTEPAEKLPIWKQIHSSLIVQKGSLQFNDGLLSELSGQIDIDPQNDPAFNVNGSFNGLGFNIEGKGGLHEDQTYWVDASLLCNDKSSAFLSLCSPDPDVFVTEAELYHCGPAALEAGCRLLAQFNPAFEAWKVANGTVKGKVMAIFKGERLSELELTDVSGEKLTLKKADRAIRLDQVKLAGSCTGPRARLKGEIGLEADCEAAGLFGLPLPSGAAHLSSHLTFKKGRMEVSGSLDYVSQLNLQFGFVSPSLFPTLSECENGWVRAEHVPPSFYQPFIKLVHKDLEMAGVLDLFGTFDQGGLELSLQCDQFVLKSPLFELKAPLIGEKDPLLLSTQGRCKLTYKDQELRIDLPLRDATLNAIEGIDAEFSLVNHGDPHEFDFSLSAQTPFGDVAIPTGSIEKGKVELKQFTAGGWKGDLALLATKEGFSMTQLDIKNELLALHGEGDLVMDGPSMRATLAMQGSYAGRAFTATEPVRIGFAPEMGWIFSQVDLEADGVHFSCDHMEYLLANHQLSARGCHFAVGRLANLPMQEINGTCSLEIKDERALFTGEIGAEPFSLELALSPLEKGRTCRLLIGADQLLLEGMWKSGSLAWDTIKGALGSTRCDFKCSSKEGVLIGNAHFEGASLLGKMIGALEGDVEGELLMQPEWAFSGKVRTGGESKTVSLSGTVQDPKVCVE